MSLADWKGGRGEGGLGRITMCYDVRLRYSGNRGEMQLSFLFVPYDQIRASSQSHLSYLD